MSESVVDLANAADTRWQRLVLAAAQLGAALAEYENARQSYIESETADG